MGEIFLLSSTKSRRLSKDRVVAIPDGTSNHTHAVKCRLDAIDHYSARSRCDRRRDRSTSIDRASIASCDRAACGARSPARARDRDRGSPARMRRERRAIGARAPRRAAPRRSSVVSQLQLRARDDADAARPASSRSRPQVRDGRLELSDRSIEQRRRAPSARARLAISGSATRPRRAASSSACHVSQAGRADRAGRRPGSRR